MVRFDVGIDIIVNVSIKALGVIIVVVGCFRFKGEPWSWCCGSDL